MINSARDSILVPELLEMVSQNPGTSKVLYRMPSTFDVDGPSGLTSSNVVDSENIRRSPKSTVKWERAFDNEWERNVIVGSILCKWRGCLLARTIL